MPDRHAPQLLIKIDGSYSLKTDTGETFDLRNGTAILGAHVDLRLDNPDMFTVEFNMKKFAKFALLDAFKPGAEVSISMGLTDAAVELCVGEIAYIEPSFDADLGFRTTISGYHKLHRLTRGQRSKTWGDGLQATQTPTTAVKQVIDDSKSQQGGASDSLSTGKLSSTTVKHDYIPQLNVSDFEFLRAIGASLEFKADPTGNKDVQFIKPDAKATPVSKLSWERPQPGDKTGGLVLAVQLRLSTVQQYSAVEVRSWDFKTKKNIVGIVKSSTYAFTGEAGAEMAGKALYGSASSGRKYVVVDQPVNSKEEAQALAQALFDQFSMDLLTGELTVQGDPKLLPGKTVELVGFGKAYTGVYLITAATHTYRPSEGYRTTISVSRNVKGN